jgi:hypothetical protein
MDLCLVHGHGHVLGLIDLQTFYLNAMGFQNFTMLGRRLLAQTCIRLGLRLEKCLKRQNCF